MPRDLPPWELLITDLGRPPAERIARALGVGVSSVYRWNRTGKAPRMARMALFWLTRWGHSAVHTQATNDAITACGLVAGLKRERDYQRGYAERLRTERDAWRGRLVLLLRKLDPTSFAQLLDVPPAGEPDPAVEAITASLDQVDPVAPVLPPAGKQAPGMTPAEAADAAALASERAFAALASIAAR